MQKAIQTTEALYVGNLDVLGKLTATEIKEVFSGATICDILLEPGMTALDLAMKAKCFDKESELNIFSCLNYMWKPLLAGFIYLSL